jgi:hypothetical protein
LLPEESSKMWNKSFVTKIVKCKSSLLNLPLRVNKISVAKTRVTCSATVTRLPIYQRSWNKVTIFWKFTKLIFKKNATVSFTHINTFCIVIVFSYLKLTIPWPVLFLNSTIFNQFLKKIQICMNATRKIIVDF